MIKELEDIGLSENEARVYAASLEIGRATADQLSKQAKVNRSTTYVQLENLMEHGLISTYSEDKKTYFSPESPELLRRLLARQKDEVIAKERDFASFLPELIRQFNGAGERPVVRFFTGKDGITAIREDVLTTKRGDEFQVIYCKDSLENVYTEEEHQEYSTRRIERSIRARVLYTQTGITTPTSTPQKITTARFISHKQMPIEADFIIYKDNLAIMALASSLFGVIIESKKIADSMRILFNLLWEIGK